VGLLHEQSGACQNVAAVDEGREDDPDSGDEEEDNSWPLSMLATIFDSTPRLPVSTTEDSMLQCTVGLT